LSFSDPLGLKCTPLFDNSGNMIGQQCDGATPGTPYPPGYCPDGACAAYPPNHGKPMDGPFGPVCGPSSNPFAASFIPDGIWKDACQKHDDCYGTCGKTKQQCDQEFLLDSRNSAYFYAVWIGADAAYEEAQEASGCNNECK
jgi:hypothetical protein